MRPVLLAAAAVSIVAYAQAIRVLFARPDGVQPAMRVISASGTVAALLHLGALSLRPLALFRWQALALALYLLGLALFSWAWVTTRTRPLPLAFSRSAPDYMLATGPYRLMRHPFYTSYTLTWIAGCLATGSWIVLGSTIWMVVLYALAARFEEALLLAGPMSAEYRRYISEAPSGRPAGRVEQVAGRARRHQPHDGAGLSSTNRRSSV